MEAGLIAWGWAVKRRHGHPTLWLFTDAARLADVAAAVRRLPKHLCGVVFRHDGAPGRAALAARVAAICRARHLALVIAADPRLAFSLQAGLHLRGGRRPGVLPAGGRRRPVTASAHDLPELIRARRAGARIIFISPAFATPSHAGARPLGAVRWAALARHAAPAQAYALGGMAAGTVRRLGRLCAGAGAISALS